jgi:hypothetical protein
MSRGTVLPSERTSYTDAETGRKVTLRTAPGKGHNVGFYYHQNPFDARRNLVYFVSNRTGSWQLWRAHLGDGRLEQVTEFDGLGRMLVGSTVNQGGANYWMYVSPRSGRPYIGGNGRIAVIDPDTLDCRVLWQTQIADDDRTTGGDRRHANVTLLTARPAERSRAAQRGKIQVGP